MLNRKTIASSASLLLVLGCVAIWYGEQSPTGEAGAREGSTSVSLADNEHALKANQSGFQPFANQLPYESEHGDLVKSLKGIYFDRDLAVDNQGNLRISSDIKDVFDFFFSAIEEEELAVVLARIEEYLSFKLDEPALGQALHALASYVEYKSALFDLETSFSDRIAEFSSEKDVGSFGGDYLALVRDRTELVKQLRSEHLSLELHEAFYAERELYDDYMIQKLQINTDDSLSAEQKRASQEILDAQMPADFIESRKSANPVEALRIVTDSSEKADPADLYLKRVSLVGEPAAQRLTKLDAERADWTQRYEDYSIKRDAIIKSSGLSREGQLDEISTLRKNLFNETEQVRVASLDQINNAL